MPLPFELGRRQIPQDRVNPLVLINIVQKAPEVLVSLMETGILMKGPFLFLDGTHQALGIAILGGLADGSHTDVGSGTL